MVDGEIYLRPGDIHFGGGDFEVTTLLGSCVAVTLWHPHRRIGGMCHVVFPNDPSGECDNRYAACALRHFMDQVAGRATRAPDYQVGLFGGGNMFPGFCAPGPFAVGERNVERARALLKQFGFHVHSEDVGGIAYRRVQLSLISGDVNVQATNVTPGTRAERV